MAQIVLGLAMAHGPLLNTPSDQWGQRAQADRRNPALFFNGGTYTFDDLVQARAHERFERQLDAGLMQERHAAVQRGIEALGEALRRSQADVAVIVGNDQMEIFGENNLPAFLVFQGETLSNGPVPEEAAAGQGPGLSIADWAYYPERPVTYAGVPDLGAHLIRTLGRDGFDVAQSRALPRNLRHGAATTPHAFGFVYRRVMHDKVLPNVPVFINTFYPPNQPSMQRCYAFGKTLRKAIESWPSQQKVALIASGGLSHFVIEEDLDRQVLDALEMRDESAIAALPDERFESGNSETRSWVALGGAFAASDLRFQVIDYVPCYRSEAGTGQAAGFAQWA